MRKYYRHVPFMLGLTCTAVVVLGVLVGLVYLPHGPNVQNIEARLTPPGSRHLLGTDQFGRDVLSRILVGGRNTLLVGLVATAAGLFLGTLWGAISGLWGGVPDEILMRLADSLSAFPALLFAMLVITVFGQGKTTTMAAIAVANIPVFARLTRAQFLKLKESDFVTAAYSLGASNFHVTFRHIMPNCLNALLVQATASFAGAVLVEASLSYLGLGIQPPDPSWGRMLRESQTIFGLAPWVSLCTGLAIALTVLGFNLLGDALRHYTDPRMKSLG